MVTTAMYRRMERPAQGALSVTGRNLAAARHVAYWIVLLSGFFEPLLYLLSIGVGVGRLIGDVPLTDGRLVSYAQFVAPATLAASAMTGALAETIMNFYGKLKFMKLYDATLATPVTPLQLAGGELLWAMLRGSFYSAAFLAVMVALHLTSAAWALAAFPAAVLVGFAFGGLGMALSTLLRSWQDFDYVNVGQFALFLFSGTFAPPGSYPLAARVLIELTPLYHGVELVRGLCLGALGWPLVWHAGYLAALTVGGLWLASRRLGKLLLS
ncbi:ABC transporter permease [Dactylosporangium vinaceum]|nr:ABC transporter permease [Dactylosporangium vinaceum]UAB95344.1 ABC transporter permease [Dactylosporangium vinaceum]